MVGTCNRLSGVALVMLLLLAIDGLTPNNCGPPSLALWVVSHLATLPEADVRAMASYLADINGRAARPVAAPVDTVQYHL
jgi:hypothetical protein